jgi:hypothetical protein
MADFALELDSPLRTDVVRPSEKFGRLLRQDPPEQLGVPCQDLAILALRRGRKDEAEALARYMVAEFRVVADTIFNNWLHQILEYAIPRLGAERFELALRVPRKHLWDAFFKVGEGFSEEAVAAIRAGEVEKAALLLDHVRRVFKTMNDETVRFIQDIFTALDDAYGEDEPVRVQRRPYETIWRDRYADWEKLSPEEQLQLSCEGMRAHYGGLTRHGEFKVIDEGDRYRMVFDPCGTGGVLRRGDPETGEPPWPTTGVNRTPRPYTWGKVDVPWYCTHCSLYLEHWAAEDYGWPIRPVVFDNDPDIPVSWLIYKGRARVRAEDYRRVGLEAPPGAPE